MKTADQIRRGIVDYCEWGVANQPHIHYAQVRPVPLATPRSLPLVTDCSGFATLAYKAAGGPNPNRKDGLWKPGPMFTGTMLAAGRKVKTPIPGDLLIYGPPPGDHVVIFMYTWLGAWVVCSHGQEIGPLRILQHREETFQGYKPEIRRYVGR